MEDELYEELPGDQEELYEDLPDSAYSSSTYSPNYPPNPSPISPPPSNGAPPPLPTSSIPQYRPGAPPPPATAAPPPPPPAAAPMPPPSLPTRSPSTQLTSSGTHGKKGKDNKKKAQPPPKSSGSVSGGGLDMKEILKKARTNRTTNFDDLEKKNRDGDSDDKHMAPWANQLRKTPQHKGTAGLTESQESEPEFVRKARTLSVADSLPDEEDVRSSPPPSMPPPVSKKPVSPVTGRKPPPSPGGTPSTAPKSRVPNPASVAPKPVAGVEADNKPSWQKQRDRQIALAQAGNVDTNPTPSAKPVPTARPAPKPAKKPPIPSKVSPSLPPKSQAGGDAGDAAISPQHVAPKPRPKPSPRHLPNGNNNGPPAPPQPTVNEVKEEESPPATRSSSIKDRARSLATSMGVEPAPPSKPPAPKPIPRQSSNSNFQPPLPSKQATPTTAPAGKPPPGLPPTATTGSKPAPPIPGKVPAPKEGSSPSIARSSPKPVRTAPPVPVRANDSPPKPPPPITPPPSSITPPPSIPAKGPPVSRGQPTPPTGPTMFRRLPLRVVDPFSPPALPDRNNKPPRPQLNGGVMVSPTSIPEDEEIYDDALPPSAIPESVAVEEELYDDVAGFTPNQTTPSPYAPPSPVSSAPSGAPPPIPTLPPPNRPQEPIIQDDPDETYDDVMAFQQSTPTTRIPPSPSSNSLGPVPPTPNSLVPPSPSPLPPGSPSHYSASPTMGRKQKLSKDDKKKQKELEKQEKELKKKNELRIKNRLKGIKAHKQFNLPTDVQHLFAVEVVLEHSKTKDHIACQVGELLFVLLIAHEKIPQEKYLVEKEDGTIGFVKKNITQRTNYKSITNSTSISALSQAPPPIPGGGGDDYPEPEDIYESLAQDDEFDRPPLPTQAIPSLPPMNAGTRFPPPMAAPPPPPDGPEETYEYLPDEQ